MTALISKDGQLQIGQENISLSCHNELSKIQGSAANKPLMPPTLEPLSKNDVQTLQNRMSSNKGITFDSISDVFLRKTKITSLLTNLWSQECIQAMWETIGFARLIPLNKKWPGIPGPEDFRPIVILSPFFKFLESRFLQKLNKYLLQSMEKSQVGFVPGFGTMTNIRRMVQSIRGLKAKDRKSLLFIDFSSADNTVNREDLYAALKRKNVFSHNELELIKALHSLVHFKSLGKIIYYPNGHPQGSVLSPSPFDVYIEELLVHLKTQFPQITMFAFADDLAFVVNDEDLEEFIGKLEVKAAALSLKINKSKSATMSLWRNKQGDEESIRGYPLCWEYKYLGVWIDQKGSIRQHLKAPQPEGLLPQQPFVLDNPPAVNAQEDLFWKCLVRPYFLYLSCILDLYPSSTRYKVANLWKRTLKEVANLPKNSPDPIIMKLGDDPKLCGEYVAARTNLSTKAMLRLTPTSKNGVPKATRISGSILRGVPSNLGSIFR